MAQIAWFFMEKWGCWYQRFKICQKDIYVCMCAFVFFTYFHILWFMIYSHFNPCPSLLERMPPHLCPIPNTNKLQNLGSGLNTYRTSDSSAKGFFATMETRKWGDANRLAVSLACLCCTPKLLSYHAVESWRPFFICITQCCHQLTTTWKVLL